MSGGTESSLGSAAGADLAGRTPRIDAFVCGNDVIAIGVLTCAPSIWQARVPRGHQHSPGSNRHELFECLFLLQLSTVTVPRDTTRRRRVGRHAGRESRAMTAPRAMTRCPTPFRSAPPQFPAHTDRWTLDVSQRECGLDIASHSTAGQNCRTKVVRMTSETPISRSSGQPGWNTRHTGLAVAKLL